MSRRFWSAMGYVVGIAVAIATVAPFFWMITTSLKESWEVVAIPLVWLPSEPQWGNFVKVTRVIPFLRMFVNSMVQSCLTTVGVLATSAMAGYGLAKFDFRFRDELFGFILLTMMVPVFVLLVPLYYVIRTLGWLDTFIGLIVPNIVTGFGIFLMRQFTMGVSDDLIGAARMDGMGEFGIFSRIVVPLVKPGLAVLGMLGFIAHWDNLVWPLVVVQAPGMYTLPMGLSALLHEYEGLRNINLTMAGATIAVVPVLVIFVFLQRYVIEGLSAGAVKG